MDTDLNHLVDLLLVGGAVQLLVGLALLRLALGLSDLLIGVAIVIAAFSISLSGGTTSPTMSDSNMSAITARLESRIDPTVIGVSSPVQQGSSTEMLPSKELSVKKHSPRELRALVIVSDLKRGLTWGVALLIPFLAIDLLVAHLFALLDWRSLSVSTIATPLKLLVFIGIGAWGTLVTWMSALATGGAQ